MIQASELIEFGYDVNDGMIVIVSWSDSWGTDVDRANYRALIAEFDTEVRRSYAQGNAHSLYLQADQFITEELFQALKGMLTDWPVLDDNKLYEVEAKIREDAWYWLWTDLRGAVEAELYDDAIHDDEFGDLELYALDARDELINELQIEFVVESAVNGYYTDTHLIIERTVERVIADHRAPFVIDGQLELL